MFSEQHSRSRRCARSRKALWAAAIFALMIVLMGAGDTAPRFSQLGHQMMCVCGCGQILLECNHVGCPASDAMRNELMASLVRGDSDSLVEQSFVQKYGPTVLAAPTTQGFDRVAYLIPLVALIFGCGLMVLVVRAWRNRPTPAIAGGLRPVGGGRLQTFRDQTRRETDL